MPLVSFAHASFRYEGAPLLLDDLVLDVERGRKVGVVGPNGAGKSTMLRLMAGQLSPSAGDVVRQKGLRCAYQEQELVRAPGTTVRQEMLEVFAEHRARESKLRRLEDELPSASGQEQARLLAEYDRLQELHRVTGGYDVDQRIASVLSGLGLPEEAWDQPITRFSGGEKNIIALARVLLADPDVILLDEPSNHLDMDGLEWFIRWIRQTEATIVMVSHNRHLLDAAVQEIWEVDRGKVTPWTGNYSEWQAQKSEALALQERQYKNQQRLIRRLEFQARRLRDMAQAYDDPGQAKRAKAMLRRIEQMDKVERPDTSERRFHARLQSGDRHGTIALHVKDFTCRLGDRLLFDAAGLEVTYGERVCLMGPNGSGKTTLFRSILDEGSFDNPVLRLGKSVRVGDYNQIHQEVMNPDTTLVDWLMSRTGLLYQPATQLLHRFLFAREDLDRQVKTLSGGEKSRLQLARLVHEEANFLMLDEPTNHLDIQSCEELEQMLEEYEGTLLVISHDRYFLDRLVNTVVEIRDRRLHRFSGTFPEWLEQRRGRSTSAALALHSQKEAVARTDSKDDRRRSQEEKKALERERRRVRNRVKRLEDEIADKEEHKGRLEAALEAAYSGGDATRGSALAVELRCTEEDLRGLYASWEAAALEDERSPDGNDASAKPARAPPGSE